MKILVINSGSSSIKYELFDMIPPRSIAKGSVEKIGESLGRSNHRIHAQSGDPIVKTQEHSIASHREGLHYITEWLSKSGLLQSPHELDGIGHRVVHGGEVFREPTLLDNKVVATIREHSVLAPLHNPANLLGIEVTLKTCPDVPQVAVFDTAFHQTIPSYAYLYAIPYQYYSRLGVRRYGFHGTSHQFVARAAAKHLGQSLNELRLISLHLGNGASAAAIMHGKCVDTSMGLTPLEGLIMGTRSGDLDPAILPFLADNESMAVGELDVMLNKQSGLKGICNENDMRSILQSAELGDTRAELALQMYAYRIKKYLGAYLAVLGGADAIVFTAGIGENAPRVRELVCSGLDELGIVVDTDKNLSVANGIHELQTSHSQVRVLVVPTDEELEIAMLTQQCITAKKCE